MVFILGGEAFEMIEYTDGTVVLDKWDLRALFELYLKRGEKKQIRDEDLEEKKKEITKTLLRRIYFRLKYPRIELEWRRKNE